MSSFKKPLEIIPYQWMPPKPVGPSIWLARTNNNFTMPDTYKALGKEWQITEDIYPIPDRLIAASVMEIRLYTAIKSEEFADADDDVAMATAGVKPSSEDHSNCKEAK